MTRQGPPLDWDPLQQNTGVSKFQVHLKWLDTNSKYNVPLKHDLFVAEPEMTTHPHHLVQGA